MSISRGFPALTAFEIWMNHIAHDWSRPDDCHLDYDVVEVCRTQSWQTRHLSAAFDLKHSDRVSVLECFINGRVVLRQVGQVNFFTVRIANQFNRIFQDG